MAEAKEHFQLGQTHYSLGEFTEAATEFREAYRLRPEPAILFNIAQAMRQLNDFHHAYFYYSQYLSRRPDASNRSEVEGLMAAMKARMDEEDAVKGPQAGAVAALPESAPVKGAAAAPTAPAASSSAPAATAAPSPEVAANPVSKSVPAPAPAAAVQAAPLPESKKPGFWRAPHIAGIAAGGAAAAAGGLALAFHASAASSADTLNQRYQAGTLTTQDAGLKSDVQSKGKLATVCALSGAALLAAGAVLVFAF